MEPLHNVLSELLTALLQLASGLVLIIVIMFLVSVLTGFCVNLRNAYLKMTQKPYTEDYGHTFTTSTVTLPNNQDGWTDPDASAEPTVGSRNEFQYSIER